MEPRERPWLSEIGIASFDIAVRTHGEDSEGRALAAILFLSPATKDVTLRRRFSNFVVLARADKFYLYVAFTWNSYFFKLCETITCGNCSNNNSEGNRSWVIVSSDLFMKSPFYSCIFVLYVLYVHCAWLEHNAKSELFVWLRANQGFSLKTV